MRELDEQLGLGDHLAEHVWKERSQAYANAATTGHKSWYPRVAGACGRRFVGRKEFFENLKANYIVTLEEGKGTPFTTPVPSPRK